MSPVSAFSTVITETLSDLNSRELIMLTALEALMDGCHGVGCFLPEVQKCCLRHTHTRNKLHAQLLKVKVVIHPSG